METAERMKVKPLSVLNIDDVKNDFGMTELGELVENQLSDEESSKATKLTTAILESDATGRSELSDMITEIGRQSKGAEHKSKMLQQQISALAARGEDGGEVATSLVELVDVVEDLDPPDLDFTKPGAFSRLLSLIPGIGSPVKKYFMKYESAQTVIDRIILSLEKGKKTLKRDNISLREDQKYMRSETKRLEALIRILRAVDEQIEAKISGGYVSEEDANFLQEEILFALRKRTTNLQRKLAANQQGVISTELIIRNNLELIRGVNNAIDVTVVTLRIAIITSLALANQKIVLNKIQALETVTDDMLAKNAKRLRAQGVEIQKQAGDLGRGIDTLKQSFEDIRVAMDDFKKYRLDSLPKMASAINALGDLNAEIEGDIQKMERGTDRVPKMLAMFGIE